MIDIAAVLKKRQEFYSRIADAWPEHEVVPVFCTDCGMCVITVRHWEHQLPAHITTALIHHKPTCPQSVLDESQLEAVIMIGIRKVK